jgi:thiamine kinase-like enzyme
MSKINTGLSGCSLCFIEPGIIRKYSASEEYNQRLLNQIEKQKQFSHFIFKNIQAPEIINVNKEKLYYFDMNFVSGLSFDKYFSFANKNQIDFVLETLFGYFDDITSNCRFYTEQESKSKILTKLNTLKSNTEYENYIEYLIDEVQINQFRVPKTFSHGDLTFSNILFHKNRLYFIDFLDVFIDTFLSDLIKLKQDLFYFWNLKTQNVQSLRIQQAYRYIWNKLKSRYSDYIHSKEFEILDILNALRIAPYVKDSQHLFTIHSIIQSNETYKKFIDSHGGKLQQIS